MITFSIMIPLSCKFSAISSLNIPRDTHLILTSSVQLTKCRLENKWQTPKQINYVSTKLLAHVRRAGACNKSWSHTAIWPVWEGTSFGGAAVLPLNSHRYLCLSHNRYTTYVVKCCRIRPLSCLYDFVLMISALFWSIYDPLRHFYLLLKIQFCCQMVLMPKDIAHFSMLPWTVCSSNN